MQEKTHFSKSFVKTSGKLYYFLQGGLYIYTQRTTTLSPTFLLPAPLANTLPSTLPTTFPTTLPTKTPSSTFSFTFSCTNPSTPTPLTRIYSRKLLLLFFCLVLSATTVVGQRWVGLFSELPNSCVYTSAGSTDQIAEISIKLPGFFIREIVTEGKTYQYPEIPDGHPILDAGSPDLQSFNFTLKLPANGDMEVIVVSSEFKEFSNIDIPPSAGNINNDGKAIHTVKGGVYQVDAFYPGQLLDSHQPFTLRNTRNQVFEVYPFQYNPTTHVLRFYFNLSLKIVNKGGVGVNPLSIADLKIMPIEGLSVATLNNQTNALRTCSHESDRGSMLVICPKEYTSAIAPLVSWRKQTGIATKVVISNQFKDSLGIQNAIKAHYLQDSTLAYVLLVGDSKQIPTNRIASKASDNYYSYLSGIHTGSGHYPDIMVGRFSAETVKVGSNAVVGATSESYTTPALSSSTTYWVRRIDPSPCSTITGGATQTVTVNPTSVGGTAAATSSSVCSGTSTTVTVSGYTGAIQWQQSANGTTGWANVTGGSGATTATYTTPNLIATTYYRAVLTSGVCSLDYSTTTSVTVTTNQWQGSATGDWEVAGNWCGGIPTIDNDVVIPTGNTVTVTSATGTPAACKNLTINGTLVISAGKALTISGEHVNNSGSTGLIIESNAIGTGSLLHGSAGVNATVQRYVSGNTNLETMTYHLVSVPLSTAGNPMSEIFTGSYLYKFDESKAIAESWVAMGTATNTALPVSGGYMVYSPEASHTYLFQGPINAGAFNAAVSYSNNHYNLIPNPYPSAIDWDAASGWTRDQSKIADAIYMWPSGEGNYAEYVAGVAVHGGSRYIPSGQAFFVQTIGESPVLAMNDNVRVHNSQPFYKNDEQIPDLLRITADANNYKDEVVVRFTENATTSADYDYDAWKIYGLEGAPQLYTLASNNEMLAINSLPYLETAYTVPLNFELKAEKPVTFTFSSIESFDQSVSIYLKDELANQTIDLRSHPVYTFNHSLGNAAKRFKLIFGGAIGIDEPKADVNKMWVSGNTLYINAPELAKKQSLIEVFNPAGQRLVAKNLVLDEITTFDLTMEGFVVVKLTSGQKVMTAKGILIK